MEKNVNPLVTGNLQFGVLITIHAIVGDGFPVPAVIGGIFALFSANP